MSLKFAGLHAHSAWSISDAIGQPSEHYDFVLKNAGEDSMALAMTDHGNASGFGYIASEQKKLKQKGIPFKPIYGAELYFHPDLEQWAKDKEQAKLEKAEKDDSSDVKAEDESESKKWMNPVRRRHHLVVLAQSQKGLKNLFRLVSRSYKEGLYHFPRVDLKMLEEHREDLIISTACLAGFGSWLSMRDKDLALDDRMKNMEKEFLPLLDLFGKKNAFIEIQFNNVPEQKGVNLDLIEFSKRTGYHLISAADSHYPDPKLWREREIARLLGRQSKGMDLGEGIPKTIDELKCELYPKSGDQMLAEYRKHFKEHFSDEQLIVDSIERTFKIAHHEIEEVSPDSSVKLPVAEYIGGPDVELRRLAFDGLKKRGFAANQQYIDRLEYELKVIIDKKFSQYFLTLKEAMDEIRRACLTGPSRGSAAGSLLCYLLEITQLDPIKKGLLFERFLNPARADYPDVDSDVDDRDLAVQILRKRFGEENVLPVSNFNQFKVKSLVKDVSKLNGIPYLEVNAVTTVMEAEAKQKILDEADGDQKLTEMTFEKAKEHSPTFRAFLEKYPHLAEQIENLYKENKSIGRHAGGVCIVADPNSCMPIIRVRGEDQVPFTQGMTVQHLEIFGLVKYDFLGIATLKIIRRCIELILQNQGIDPTIENVWDFFNRNLHPDNVLNGDPAVIQNVYQKGKFVSTFQFTQPPVQGFCRSAEPKTIYDIATITAIWRPGPLKGNAHKRYVDRRRGAEVEAEHPVLDKILGSTYGLIVFQEQFLTLAHELAGFTKEEAETLRKILVKPDQSKAELMKQMRIEFGEKFVNGCVSAGLREERAKEIWEKEILGSVSYSFNQAHSEGYAHLSYNCAWLLNYHEKEWIRAVLECDPDPEKAISDVISLGYKIEKPCIKESLKDSWQIVENRCLPPLTSIKGIGETAAEEAVKNRGTIGSFEDFFWRDGEKGKKEFRWSKFNKKAIEALVKVGGFENSGWIGPTGLFTCSKHMHEVLFADFDKFKKKKIDLSALISEKDCADWTNHEKIAIQKELLGTFDKTLLLDKKVLDLFKEYNVLPISEIGILPMKHWFIVKEKTDQVTKKGKPYVRIRVCDWDDKLKSINIFEDFEDIKTNRCYVGVLHLKDEFVNIVRGQKLRCIS